jgi:hypothetical protein
MLRAVFSTLYFIDCIPCFIFHAMYMKHDIYVLYSYYILCIVFYVLCSVHCFLCIALYALHINSLQYQKKVRKRSETSKEVHTHKKEEILSPNKSPPPSPTMFFLFCFKDFCQKLSLGSENFDMSS